MNWITKFIKPKIKSLFKKRSSKTDEIFGLHVVVKFNLQRGYGRKLKSLS